MTPDELFDLLPGTVVKLAGLEYKRRDVAPGLFGSAEPEFSDCLGEFYDADDLDGAEVVGEQ